ncbi:uncharacterized protein LOC129793717 [Lutzomyia longipalpis]|uniref:uncharacterized protein LOC129793717 n=1 Tax=Lutzomyia longipalpis TaxID=7200 RepID=UPI00248343E9|nr:uncharacterized protein LOC129793717 [Lutzomyia longipalpis]
MGMRRKLKKKSNFGDFGDGSNFFRNKSTSEPDLSDTSPPQTSRWHKKLPHEYITVDELGFHRRRRPPEIYTRSNICLYNTSEPCIPFSALKSEYNRRYHDPPIPPPPRSPLLRRPTSLRVTETKSMEAESEHKEKFRLFLEDELSNCRQSAYKFPENLKLTGEVDYRPEYASSYVPYSMVEVRRIIEDRPLQEITNRQHFPMSNLPIEGDAMYKPEYRSQFVEFPVIEKSHSIPQMSNIRIQGDFQGVPEYAEKFKSYDNVAKSNPIRKPDNLNVSGDIDVVPEYREQFREHERSALERCQLMRKDDHLKMSGDFGKTPPEYYESFKDHNITAPPHRAKAREPFLNLNGTTEFNPEYKCRFLDFPRSRPVTRKPDSHFRLSALPDGTYIKRFTKNPAPPPNIHTPPEILPFQALPEYRKAKTDYIIKERTPSRDHIPSAVGPRKDHNDNTERARRRSSIAPPQDDPNSPTFRLMVENVDDPPAGRFRSPRFGRRATGGAPEVDENATRIRERVSVVEGNKKYSARSRDVNGNAFVVLKQPGGKQSEWMKPKWYEGAS